jgi:hypothetical protein
MGWWFPRAATRPDEQVVFEAAANVYVGWRAVGGKVTVTTRRLLFTPNWLDGATGGAAITLDRGDIRGVEIMSGKQSPVRFLGLAPWRPVVGIDHTNGPTYYFLVRKPNLLAIAVKDSV